MGWFDWTYSVGNEYYMYMCALKSIYEYIEKRQFAIVRVSQLWLSTSHSCFLPRIMCSKIEQSIYGKPVYVLYSKLVPKIFGQLHSTHFGLTISIYFPCCNDTLIVRNPHLICPWFELVFMVIYAYEILSVAMGFGCNLITQHLPVSSRILGCEENLYFERWNSRTHQTIHPIRSN